MGDEYCVAHRLDQLVSRSERPGCGAFERLGQLHGGVVAVGVDSGRESREVRKHEAPLDGHCRRRYGSCSPAGDHRFGWC